MVGRAEAAVEKATLVTAAFNAGKLRGEALALVCQRGVHEALCTEVTTIRPTPAQPSQGVWRSWRDVVVGSAGNWQERGPRGLVGWGSTGGATQGRKWEPS